MMSWTGKIPAQVKLVLRILEENGYESYVVGGCVRDSLMGRTPADWDVGTAAQPDQVHAALSAHRVVDTGLRHGTVTAVIDGQPIEITTFREEGEYLDFRRPSSVSFTADLKQDLARRDFTINAMAYSERTGVVDPFGGIQDLSRGVIRAVGDADQRFREDALRILRALRFSATLGFDIESQTARAILDCRGLLGHIASERIRDEFSLLICGHNVTPVLLEYADAIAEFLPEIVPSIGFHQNNYHHIYDVWEHTVHSIAAVESELVLRLVMLLHDLGKPQSYTEDADGVGHFYGHPMISTGIAGGALLRLRYDRATIRQVCTLVEYHDSHLFPTENSVRRWLMRLGEENLRLLIKVKRADNLAQSPDWRGRQEELARTSEVLEQVLREKKAFSREQLQVKGTDMIALGADGPQIGRLLDVLLEEVMSGRVRNEKGPLLALAQRIMDSWSL